MKYKALITGKNNSVIDDFFTQTNDCFESVTTSARYEDIIRHLKYFQPDLFIYCIYNEPRESISRMASLKSRLSLEKIPFILIGSKEDYDEFDKITVGIPDLVVLKPLSVSAIQERIVNFMDTNYPARNMNRNPSPNAPANMPVQNYNNPDNKPGRKTAAAYYESLLHKHILVVDDNPLMLRSIKELLKDKYDIATAVNGKLALKFLENKTTDLILLDYEMPEENGPAVLEKLRANEATKDIPVIFLTGITEQNKIHEALILKPQGYLLKPVDHEKLLSAISKCIG